MFDVEQNSLATVDINLTIVEYHGLGTGVEPSGSPIVTA